MNFAKWLLKHPRIIVTTVLVVVLGIANYMNSERKSPTSERSISNTTLE